MIKYKFTIFVSLISFSISGGLAASQSRLLIIQSRKTDCESKLMSINLERMKLNLEYKNLIDKKSIYFNDAKSIEKVCIIGQKIYKPKGVILSDESAKEYALDKYQKEKEIISEKETLLDIEITRLNTELEAINAELESIKKIINENIERSFSLFD